jgi:hypothetical protein
MPSILFNEELSAVEPARSFTYTVNPAWGENEWSVSGWTVTGGSDAALEHGASEALHALGYRFWTPQKTTRPASLPAGGVTLARQQFVFTYCLMYLNYGFGNATLQTEYVRWATLNNVNDRRRPVGHTWGAIINWANAQNGYYTSNPGLLINNGTSFELVEPVARAANLAKCVEWCRLNINEFQRCSFDPADGDTQSSEVVFGFANDVVAELRATTHPQAMLGLYAYAGHRAPVAFPCPYLYVQVALGFNNLGIGYQALVQQWGAVAAEVALRGYGDIAAQDGWLPAYSGITRANFFIGEYPGYIASGANGINMETSGNWLKNMVSHWHALRYWKTGQGTHASALAEMLPALFNNDPAVLALYNLWGDPTTLLTDDLIYQSCQIIDQMQQPHRAEFRRYMTFVMRDRLLSSMGTTRDGVYMSRLEQNLRWVWAMEADGSVHSNAYSRQLANSNVTDNGRPDLNLGSSPHYRRFPAYSTDEDYIAHRDALARRVVRASVFSDTDLVEVTVAPTGQAAALLTPATDYTTLGIAVFVFIGPGTVTTDYLESFRATEVREFGPGMHTFSIAASATTSWVGGTLYLRAFPAVRLDPSLSGQRWAYVPRISRGRLRVSSESRLTLIDSVSRKDIAQNFAPFSSGMANPQTIVPGVARVDNINTRGTHVFGNLSPYVSPSPTVQLMPRALAAREGLSFVEAA